MLLNRTDKFVNIYNANALMYKLFCVILGYKTLAVYWSSVDIRCQFTLGMIMMSMNSIEQAIRPLFLMWHILGLGFYTSKPYLSTLYNVTVWCAYSYLFYYTAITIKKKEWFQATSTIIYYGMNFLVSIIFIIISLYQHKVCTYICIFNIWINLLKSVKVLRFLQHTKI